MSRNLFYFLLFYFGFFCFVTQSRAATITVSSDSDTLSSDAIYTVHVALNINTGNDTVYYLRGVFFKPNTSSYCGYTWNGDTWFAGPYSTDSGWKKFYQLP